ncbi:hypothetical protein G6F35_006283 [Rhizopus arrhizus]|nr:hypothetical protein G6F35_006283 [Rhizopus arrhizus]
MRSDLIGALLLLSRNERGQGTSNVARVAEQLLDAHRAQLGGKPLELALEGERDLVIDAPEAALSVALGNLIGNAVKYSQDGEVRVHVSANAVSVTDSGPGLSEEDAAKLFQRGYRGTHAGHSQGGGIGLSIVSRLCDLYGWQSQMLLPGSPTVRQELRHVIPHPLPEPVSTGRRIDQAAVCRNRPARRGRTVRARWPDADAEGADGHRRFHAAHRAECPGGWHAGRHPAHRRRNHELDPDDVCRACRTHPGRPVAGRAPGCDEWPAAGCAGADQPRTTAVAGRKESGHFSDCVLGIDPPRLEAWKARFFARCVCQGTAMDHRSSFVAAHEASSRVHRFCGPTALRLIVERWHGSESLSEGLRCQIDLLGEPCEHSLDDWVARPASITTRLPDGADVVRVGLIRSVERLACAGRLVRYRVHLADWTAWLHDSRHSRVFQDQDVASIISTVLSVHAPLAHWSWHVGSTAAIDRRCRGYRVQYRQSDMAFLQQLLAYEGLGWCIRTLPDVPGGHTMMIFGDSTRCSLLSRPRRLHQTQRVPDDAGIALLHETCRVVPTHMTRVADLDDPLRVVSASLPVRTVASGPLEDYSPARHAAWETSREALAEVMRDTEAALCEQRRWTGEGTEPDFQPGYAFEVLPEPGQRVAPALLLTAVQHAAVNTLPEVLELQQHLPLHALPDTGWAVDGPWPATGHCARWR